MTWPAAWVRDVEAAGNTYNVLTAFRRANQTLEGDALARWTTENGRIVRAALEIERLRGDSDGDD